MHSSPAAKGLYLVLHFGGENLDSTLLEVDVEGIYEVIYLERSLFNAPM